MSGIIGHAIVGCAVLETARGFAPELFSGRKAMVAFPAVALLPDVDSILGAIGGNAFGFLSLPGGYPIHRGVTHTLAFALASGLLAAIAVLPRAPHRWLAAWPWLALSAATHPLIDSLMGLGAGIPFFWPLSCERFLSPFRLVPIAYFAYSVGGLVSLLWEPLVWALSLHEAVLFLPLLFLARRWRMVRAADTDLPVATSRGACIAGLIALCAILCPAVILASGLQPVDGDVGGTPLILWLGIWFAIVVLASILTGESLRRRRDADRPMAAPFSPIVPALLISGLASYLV